jgi:hypothetical protein
MTVTVPYKLDVIYSHALQKHLPSVFKNQVNAYPCINWYYYKNHIVTWIARQWHNKHLLA